MAEHDPPAIYNLNMPRVPVRLFVGIAFAILIIILVWTSYYTVQAESEGVVLRFGKFLKTVEPGCPSNSLWHRRGGDLPTRRQLKRELDSSLGT